ncbi:MAG: MBL fold metallo-hydrolase [Synergistes sp.]|nr:MBL fold metallo-hydrolase [Synergistes sp.]
MEEKFVYPENFIKYLGTSGGRFSMISQQRSTGGVWFRYGGLQGVIDPGPGSLVRICEAEPRLSVENIDAVILTHKHIDHSSDANVLIECMTHGGFESHGVLVAPNDAINGDEAVVIKFSQRRVPRIIMPEDGKIFQIGDVRIEPVTHVHHGVECFGYIFRCKGLNEWGMISDSKMLPEFSVRYAKCAFMSVNVTFADMRKHLDHISVGEAKEMFAKLHPDTAVLTHLGAMLTAPDGKQYLQDLSTDKSRVIPASDGMVVDLDTNDVYEVEESAIKNISYRKMMG